MKDRTEEKRRWRERNKEYLKEYRKSYYTKNRDAILLHHQERRDYYRNADKEYRTKNKDILKDKRFMREYNITLEDYNKMFEDQNGCCAICGRHQTEMKRTLAVDHSHITGKVRGLLCYQCNAGIAFFGDNSILLMKAAAYLESFL